jgi:dimethylaniline monooxygenase (N-oxide forming)
MDSKKVIIVGAGVYGLIAAKTYLQVNPRIDLTVIDADSSVGGVWSKSRVHPGLLVDSPSPSFEFSDMQMEEEFGVPQWSDLTGDMMSEYLERFAVKFEILRRCKLRTKVISIEKDGKGWIVHTRPAGDALVDVVESLTCDVLIVATGLFSRANIPDIDTSAFTGIVMHSMDLRNRHSDLTSDEIKSVVIVGGNKSSVEAAALCALAGKKVHWLIRKEGAGPTLLVNPRLSNGESAFKPVVCRWSQFNVPTIYRYRGTWDWFFSSGKSSLGSRFREWFWSFVTKRGLGDRYEKSKNGKLLKPDVCK